MFRRERERERRGKFLLTVFVGIFLVSCVSAGEIDACATLSLANTVYTLNQSVNSSGTCFTISAENITLDCAGYTINYSQSGGASERGVYSEEDYTKIYNCTIIDGNLSSINSNRDSIRFSTVNNGEIKDNNIDINATSSSAIVISLSLNNILMNNILRSTYRSLTFSHSSYNLISELNASDTIGDAIFLTNSSMNNITDCIHLSGGSSREIYSTAPDNSREIINYLINCSYGLAEVGNSRNSSFVRKWYIQTTVNDSSGFLSGAGVNITNSSSGNVFSKTTNASGTTTPMRYEAIEYIQNETGKYYQTPHNVTVSKSGYPSNSSVYNLTSLGDGNLTRRNVLRTVFLDNTLPTLTFSCSPTSIRTGQGISCSCSATDNLDSTPAVSYTTTPATSSTGSFTTMCSAVDYYGNNKSSSISYTVSPYGGAASGSGSSSSSSTTWSNTYVVNSEDFANGYSKQLASKQRMKVSLGAETHYIGVKSLTETSATIEISSDPVIVNLNVGGETKLDLDSDGFYDLLVKLNSVLNNKADLTVKEISEKVPASQEGENIQVTDGEVVGSDDEQEVVSEENSFNYWYLVIGIVFVLIIGFVLMKKFSNKKKGR